MTTPKKHGQKWTDKDIQVLKQLIKENTPTRVIGLKMERTEDSIKSKVQKENLSLNPPNQSPYDRKVSKAKKK